MVSFVNEHRDLWPVAVMCRTIGLPERTFHAATTRTPSARSISDARHAVEIRRVWTANYSCYGPRRVHKQLRREDYVVARCTVTRVMAEDRSARRATRPQAVHDDPRRHRRPAR
jgi:hypothetical protein